MLTLIGKITEARNDYATEAAQQIAAIDEAIDGYHERYRAEAMAAYIERELSGIRSERSQVYIYDRSYSLITEIVAFCKVTNDKPSDVLSVDDLRTLACAIGRNFEHTGFGLVVVLDAINEWATRTAA